MPNKSGATHDGSSTSSQAVSTSADSRKAVVPALRYRDLGAAIVWLCEAFDFKKSKVLANETGNVIYAELSFGDSMIMLGSMNDQNVGRLFKQPDEIGGAETQTCYLLVDDVEAYHQRAKRAGAQFVSVINHADSEARSFGCRDLEGHIWFFGEHAPRAPKTTRRMTSRQVFASALLASLVIGASAWGYVSYVDKTKQHAAAEQRARSADELAARERALHQSTATALNEARQQLDRNRRVRDSANDAMINATARVAAERLARAKADRKLRTLREQLGLQQDENRSIGEKLSELRQTLLAERAQGQEREQRALARLAEERDARANADRKVQSVERQLELQRNENQVAAEKLSQLRQALLAEQQQRQQREKRAAAELEKEREARATADRKTAAALAKLEELQSEVEQKTTSRNERTSATERLDSEPKKPLERFSRAARKDRPSGVTRRLRAAAEASKPPPNPSSNIRLRVRVR